MEDKCGARHKIENYKNPLNRIKTSGNSFTADPVMASRVNLSNHWT